MDRVLPPDAQTIPAHAKCVFKGEVFDTYQWVEALYDGSSATFEMLKRPDTVKVVGLKGGKIVVIKDTQPATPSKITFPGGRVNVSDISWLRAAQREMHEETGLSFKTWKLIEVVQPVAKIEWFVVWYVAYDLADEVKPETDGGEKIIVQEYDFEECFEIIFTETNKETQYIPSSIKSAKSLDDLTKLGEYNGAA
jgi:ADP-ribose pyrophosphatase